MCSQGTRRGISRGTTCRTRRLSASAGARTEARSTSWARPLPAAALIRSSLCSNATHSADVVRSCPAGDGLTTFNFTSPAHWTTLGFSFGPWGGSYFNGYMANVGLWRRPIDDSEVSCLYKCKRDFLWRVCLFSCSLTRRCRDRRRDSPRAPHSVNCFGKQNINFVQLLVPNSISESRALATPDTARKAGERHNR